MLSVKAQFLLEIPATAVLSERHWSDSGNITTQRNFPRTCFFEKLHQVNCSKLKLKITVLFTLFINNRRDYYSGFSFFFNPHELTKIVLQNIIAPNCTIWSSELNKKGFPFSRVTYHTRRDQRVPPSNFFFGTATFFPEIFSPQGPPSIFCCFATEWMLENPKGSPFVFFGTVRLFPENKNFSLLQFLDVLRQNPFNCDKNVDNFRNVPPFSAPLGSFFCVCNFFEKFFRKIFDFRVL